MKPRVVLVTALVATLTTSCATQALWKATNPDARVPTATGEVINVEPRVAGEDAHEEFTVAKTRSERFRDHALRAFFTPATVCIDVASVSLLILGPSFVQGSLDNLALESGGRPSETSRYQAIPEVEGPADIQP